MDWSEKHRRIVGDKVFHGPSGVEAATREWFEAWDFYEAEAEEILDAGDSVVVLSRARGRSKYGGVAVEARSGEIWTLRGGKVVRFTGYDTRAEALKAAGLSE